VSELKKKRAAQVQNALDTTLSGLQDDPWLGKKIIQSEKNKRGITRKVSFGAIIATILTLIAITALAATALNYLYERIIQKEGQFGSIENWNTENLVELIDWMQDTGITLDKEELDKLNNDNLNDTQKRELALEIIKSYYPSRDGILSTIDIMAKEKGPIEYWTLEDKNWLSEMYAQYYPEEIELGRNLIPEEQDITREQAESIFFSELEKKYGQKREDMDMDTLSVSFGIGHFTIDDSSENIRHWTFELQSKDHKESFGAYIRANDGEIIQITSSTIKEKDWIDEYAEDRISFNARTSAVGFYNFLHKWKPILSKLIETGEINPDEKPYVNSDIMYWYDITDVVGLPQTDDLTQDEAQELADAAIISQLRWTTEELHCFTPWVSYRIDDVNQPVYWFVYRWYGNNNASELFENGKITKKVVVQISAKTGKVVKLEADNVVTENGGRSNSVGM